VVDRSLVVGTWFLQHVIEHTGTSRCRSRALSGRVNYEGFVPVVIVLVRACLAARLLAFFAPLVLLEDHVWFEDRWMVTSLCDE
jgi:hypothetical protein